MNHEVAMKIMVTDHRSIRSRLCDETTGTRNPKRRKNREENKENAEQKTRIKGFVINTAYEAPKY